MKRKGMCPDEFNPQALVAGDDAGKMENLKKCGGPDMEFGLSNAGKSG